MESYPSDDYPDTSDSTLAMLLQYAGNVSPCP